MLGTSVLDEVGEWIDTGREIWLGIIPGIDPAALTTATQVTKRLLAWWRRWVFRHRRTSTQHLHAQLRVGRGIAKMGSLGPETGGRGGPQSVGGAGQDSP